MNMMFCALLKRGFHPGIANTIVLGFFLFSFSELIVLLPVAAAAFVF
jgi:hypothetical protein